MINPIIIEKLINADFMDTNNFVELPYKCLV